MTLAGSNWKLQFEKNNYQPLQLHYNELTRRSIMAEYAERGIERISRCAATWRWITSA